MWRAMKASRYVEIAETPLKVLDSEVPGKGVQFMSRSRRGMGS
jgi:hypothetical protein